ncbi:hypothetical protein Tco_0737127 [Tanacetum coccineum]
MAERTMEELLRAPTEGYGEAIVLPEINADHFEIKTNLLQLVQTNPFNGRENENPHAHINSFKRITSTLRFRMIPNDVISNDFPYSLEGAAKLNLLPTIKCLSHDKGKLLELLRIPLNENCSAMLLKKLPEKLGDPGKFLIPFCEEYAPELLGFSNSSGGNPTPTSEPFTSEFILEEIEAYLKDDSISPEIDHADCNPEEDIIIVYSKILFK